MAFSFYRTITIDPTKVGGSNQSNFPVLVAGTYSYLATVANGGKVQNANGYDVGFYSDAALTTKLDWEIELYTAATGVVVYWVRVPTVSSSVNTVIYMAYGDASISTNQSNATGAWDSAFLGVYHLPNGTSLTTLDSTSNANNGTNNSGTATAGQMDGAAAFASSAYVDLAQTISPNNITVSCWVKAASYPLFSYFVSREGTAAPKYGWALRVDGSSLLSFAVADNTIQAQASNFGLPTVNVWQQVTGTYDGTTIRLYLNGSQVATSTGISGNMFVPTGVNARIASGEGFSRFFTGSVDEVEISNTARSAAWITGQYNNQNSPSTFYAIGSEVLLAISFGWHPELQRPVANPIKVVGY